MRQDRPGHRGRRGVPAARVEQHPDAVGGEHLQRADLGRLGQRVRVRARGTAARRCPGGPVLADRLGGGDDVVLVERRRQRGPAVAGRAERHPLGGVIRVGMQRVVRGDQLRDIHQILSDTGLPRTQTRHGVILARQPGEGHRPRVQRRPLIDAIMPGWSASQPMTIRPEPSRQRCPACRGPACRGPACRGLPRNSRRCPAAHRPAVQLPHWRRPAGGRRLDRRTDRAGLVPGSNPPRWPGKTSGSRLTADDRASGRSIRQRQDHGRHVARRAARLAVRGRRLLPPGRERRQDAGRPAAYRCGPPAVVRRDGGLDGRADRGRAVRGARLLCAQALLPCRAARRGSRRRGWHSCR